MRRGKLGKYKTRGVKRQTGQTGPDARRLKGQRAIENPGRRSRNSQIALLVPKASERSAYRKVFDLAKKEGPTRHVAEKLWEMHKHGDARATYALATWYVN